MDYSLKTAGARAALEALGLTKLAVRIPAMHGTFNEFSQLRPGASAKNVMRDPNAQAVFMATKKRSALKSVQAFAEQAVEHQGRGAPVIAHAKIDTRKGWLPFQTTRRADVAGVELPDLHDVVKKLDQPNLTKQDRGPLWRQLHDYVGSWRNSDLATTVTPSHYTPVKPRLPK